MTAPGAEDGQGASGGRGAWEKREHQEVFRALAEALAAIRFPATKGRLVEEAGGAAVSGTLPLIRYLEFLPERRYRSADEVVAALEDRWHATRDARGQGWGASERGGAIPEEMR
ncbi:MAG TPA: DUF2795 domain-containing protein [Candidatus Thermoplasmatota archaeon]|nr:DUF2795 domain-containing protein [Candidatus Thermoplasmatota archaeon]